MLECFQQGRDEGSEISKRENVLGFARRDGAQAHPCFAGASPARRQEPAAELRSVLSQRDPSAGSGRRRLLVLLPFPPQVDGDHGAARVSGQLVSRLAQHIDVAVLCLRHPSEEPGDPAFVARLVRYQEVPRPATITFADRAQRAVRWRAALAKGQPFWASDLRSVAFARELVSTLHDFRPDVVQIEFTVMGQYLDALDTLPRPRVLVEHDPSFAFERREDHSDERRGQAIAWRRMAGEVLRRVDRAVVFTERDRTALTRLSGSTPVHCIPFGTELVAREPAFAAQPGRLLFVGNFVHPPNVDAARWLIKSIFPRLRQHCSECELYIVGARAPVELVRTAPPGVTFTGRLPDVSEQLDRAAVVLAPLRTGAGMRVKVVEALAAGKAVVASPLAAEGLAVVDGQELRLAADPEAFAGAVADLIRDETARLELGRCARRWAEAHLGWDTTVNAYLRLYAELLGADAPTPATALRSAADGSSGGSGTTAPSSQRPLAG